MDRWVKCSRSIDNTFFTRLQSVHLGTTRKRRQRLEGLGNPRKRSKYQNRPSSPTSRPSVNSFLIRSTSATSRSLAYRDSLHCRIISNALSEMNYDANKLPLGLLDPSTARGMLVDGNVYRKTRKIDHLVRVLRPERTFRGYQPA